MPNKSKSGKPRVSQARERAERLKKAEETLRLSENRFRVALQNSSIDVFNQDLDLRYTWLYNPKPGFSIQSVVGKTDYEILSSQEAAQIISIKREVLRTGQPAHAEVTYGSGAEARYFEIFIEPTRDARGAITGLAGAGIEVTESKRAAQERDRLLREAEAALLRAELDEERVARLQAVTASLSEAVNEEQVASVIVRQGVTSLGADAAVFTRLDESGASLHIELHTGFPHELVERFAAVPVTAALPACECVRTGQPIWIEDVHKVEGRYPDIRPLTVSGFSAHAGLPLLVEGRTIGAVVLSFREKRKFEEEDRAFMRALVQQCALAFWRARLYEDERAARRQAEAMRGRAALLAEASRVLGSSLDYEKALAGMADLIVDRLADGCEIDILSPEGKLEPLAIRHRDPALAEAVADFRRRVPFEPDGKYGQARVVQTGMSELYVEVTDRVRSVLSEKDGELLRMLAPGSLLLVPLAARGRAFGAVAMMRSAGSGRRFDDEDLALAEELGRRAALAMDNARLYEEAQSAIRIRDQFFTVASHELKTPLTTMMGYAELLYRMLPPGGQANERYSRAVRTIYEQTERLNRMINALLDVSRIENGQLTLERGMVDLCELTARLARDLAQGLTRHALEFSGPGSPVVIDGDALRLEQALQNLIQNAVKYSPHGGRVQVRVEPRGKMAAVSVEDEGIGVPEEDMPRLFDRFYRARNAETWHISGMGVGLYVVREIVALHGGRVEVKSREKEGSTFTMMLPLLQP